MEIRDLRPDETPFLQEMLYTALAWRTGVELPPLEWVMDHPQLAPFHTAWRRDGDTALVAEDAVPIGLAWYRFFTDAEHGEGFVDLAVDHDNPARHLYERLGYVALAEGEDDDRMVLELA